jgi:uncharacterized protein (DUF488 family)
VDNSVTFTIGYSGRTVPGFVAVLRRAQVQRVVDVRALPLSRKRGFSKTALAMALAEAGIEYVHLRTAGNPFRELRNDPPRCLALYSQHVDRHPELVSELQEAVSGQATALLCVEESHSDCHRSILADRLSRRAPSRRVQHL